MKKTFFNFVTFLATFVLTSGSLVAQTPQPSPMSRIPDVAMKQVVNRLLRYSFKPSRHRRTVPIANIGVLREWLPKILNIEFKLVSHNEAMTYPKGVFQLSDPIQNGRGYEIDVGWGDTECVGSGETWKFVVDSGNRVRLWNTGNRWGRGCGVGGTGPPVIPGLKVGEISPNELPGYQFFKTGKLKNIRLGKSTREDMKSLFDGTCEGPCDYDANWTIWVNYFDQDSVGSVSSTDANGEEINYEYAPKTEYVGTLRFVNLRPKLPISFKGFIFPRTFRINQLYSVGDCWDENGFCGATHWANDFYEDGYGLRYTLFGDETFNNVSKPNQADANRRQRGELLSINYEIPDSLRSAINNERRVERKKK